MHTIPKKPGVPTDDLLNGFRGFRVEGFQQIMHILRGGFVFFMDLTEQRVTSHVLPQLVYSRS